MIDGGVVSWPCWQGLCWFLPNGSVVWLFFMGKTYQRNVGSNSLQELDDLTSQS